MDFILIIMGVSFLGVYIWVSSLQRQQKKQDAILERISKTESLIAESPRQGDITKVHERVDAIERVVHQQRGTLDQIDKNIKLIHQHLLDKK